MILTQDQEKALHKKWKQSDQGMTYPKFLDTVKPLPFDNCVIVLWSEIWLGIEVDGYCHT